MKDQSRSASRLRTPQDAPDCHPRRVHVALAEPILRIGAARQARLWLKKNSETIPPPCLNVPHACDGTASSVGGSERRRSYAANPCAPCVLPWVDLRQRPSLTMLFRTEATPTASGLERYRASASAVTTEPRGRLSGLAILAISAWTGGRSIEIIRATVASSEQRCFRGVPSLNVLEFGVT